MDGRTKSPEPQPRRADALAAAGLFLLVVGAYVLSGPGRIDIIDGQLAYDSALSLLQRGRPLLRDPAIQHLGVVAEDGSVYTPYPPLPALASTPALLLAGGPQSDPAGEQRRFAFVLGSAVYGALVAPLLFAFYRLLGVARRASAGWTLALGFGSLLWPLSTSTFDEAQHALLALAAVLLGFLSAARGSRWLAAASGVVVAVAINYQETYLLLAPILGLVVLVPGESQESRRRYLLFLLGCALGPAFWVHYNLEAFGTLFPLHRYGVGPWHPPLFGNPVAGALGLLFSPGKSIFLYSPVLLLGLLGWRGLRQRAPILARTVLIATIVHLGFVSCLSFFGSDWAWGPRYSVVLLPLWALAFPWLPVASWSRLLGAAVITVGVGVQMMGLAVDHQRFFLERALPDHFWARDPWFYFEQSALAARPREIRETWDSIPPGVVAFRPGPYPQWRTYAVMGDGLDRDRAPEWVRRFAVFYLPRPWPLWTAALPPAERPVPRMTWMLAVASLITIGAGACFWGLRRPESGAA